jgi:Intracellular proteinase inhibitor
MKIRIIILNFLLFYLLTSGSILSQNRDIRLRLDLKKSNYSVADTLKGTFSITNLSSKPLKFDFSTSCQYGLKIKSGDKAVKQYPEVCAQVLTSLVLQGGKSKVYQFKYPLVDNDLNTLPKGDYIIEAYLLDNNSSIVSKSIKIN